MQSFSVYKRKRDKRKKNTKWLVAWTNEYGVRKAKTAYTDYEASVELGRKLAKQAAMRRMGVTDHYEQYRETPIGEHVAAFLDTLRSANRVPRYIRDVERRIRLIVDGLKVKFFHDLDPVAVDRFLTDLAQKRNLSGITRNEYLAAIKSFTRWAVTFRRLRDDPLAGLRVQERSAFEPVHPRRALTMAEIGRLLVAAEQRPLREIQTIRAGENAGKPLAKVGKKAKAWAHWKGRERRLVYMIAVWTGLRRNEIRQLIWADLHVGSSPCRITLRARTTKSKRADSIPVHPQLAEELRAWRPSTAGPSDPVVSTVPNMRCFRADLAAAGIAYKDESGRYADFHGLRMSLSTMLATNRVSPRTAQAIMRHADPRLTANVYTDEKLLPLAAELFNVPSIPTSDSAPVQNPPVTDRNLLAFVADLSEAQKRSLLELLSRPTASP